MDDTNLNVESADPTIFIPADIKNTHETTFVLDDKPDSTLVIPADIKNTHETTFVLDDKPDSTPK